MFLWLAFMCVVYSHVCGFCVLWVVWELCESLPAVTRLTVYRRPQVMSDSQSSPASSKKLSSKSNNEHREKAGPDQSKTNYGK